MKENEREREISSQRKPTHRSDFYAAYVVQKADVDAVVTEGIVDSDAEKETVDSSDSNSDDYDDIDAIRDSNEATAVDANLRSDAKVVETNVVETNVDDFGKFCVGMVMRHKKYNYICVIYGWDPVCKASKVNEFV